MSEDDKPVPPPVPAVKTRQGQQYRRLVNGQFVTKRLTVNEKQFRSLVAWGKRHGVVVERLDGYSRRKKEGQDGSGTTGDSLP